MAHDPRLANALQLIREQAGCAGALAAGVRLLHGKTWADFGTKKQPNKWVTLRALRVLRAAQL